MDLPDAEPAGVADRVPDIVGQSDTHALPTRARRRTLHRHGRRRTSLLMRALPESDEPQPDQSDDGSLRTACRCEPRLARRAITTVKSRVAFAVTDPHL